MSKGDFFMRFWSWKQSIALLSALLIACTVFVGVRAVNALPLSSLAGEHTYYTYSASSQSQIQKQLAPADFLHLQGESVQVCLADNDIQDLHAYAQALCKRYKARIVCVEQTGDVISYYAYSPMLKGGVAVFGKKVNFHVAFSTDSDRCVVGSPLIFGGF